MTIQRRWQNRAHRTYFQRRPYYETNIVDRIVFHGVTTQNVELMESPIETGNNRNT
jgi:hypothetical protein